MANNYIEFSEQIVCETEEQAKWLCAEIEKGSDEFGSPCSAEFENGEVWVYSEESGDVDGLVAILAEFQTHFGLQEPIILSWSCRCDRPRIGEFDGGAVVVVGGHSHFINARSWALDLAEKLVPKEKRREQ